MASGVGTLADLRPSAKVTVRTDPDEAEVRGPKSDVRRPTSAFSLRPLRRLGDPTASPVHNRVRRIDDYVFIAVQAGDDFDFAAEVMTERDLLQLHLLAVALPRRPADLRSGRAAC